MDDWNDEPDRRPTESDFVEFAEDLDAQCAWENFGGLSRHEAYELLCDNPISRPEDFMWMGGVAFAYYYPALERYVLEHRVAEATDEVEGIWFIARCILMQFRGQPVAPVQQLRPRILNLARHVRGNIERYNVYAQRRIEIDEAWRELEEAMSSGSSTATE